MRRRCPKRRHRAAVAYMWTDPATCRFHRQHSRLSDHDKETDARYFHLCLPGWHGVSRSDRVNFRTDTSMVGRSEHRRRQGRSNCGISGTRRVLPLQFSVYRGLLGLFFIIVYIIMSSIAH